MANPLHLNLLDKGAKAIRAWKDANRGEQLDLSSALLSSKDLRGLPLDFADLREADLSYAKLAGTFLASTDLAGANLAHADLTGAQLLFANLTGASLQDADFSRANLTGSTLVDCTFDGALFRGAALTGVAVSSTAASANFEAAKMEYIGIGIKPLVVSSAIPSDVLREFTFAIKRGPKGRTFSITLLLKMYGGMGKVGVRRLFQAVSWPVARHFGNLTILTRASYLLLVIVPLLAGIWPAVGKMSGKYNEILFASAVAAKSAETRLDEVVTRVHNLPPIPTESANRELLDAIRRATRELQAAQASIQQAASSPPPFPLTLAALFFAALSVAVGHLLYELRADPLVKQSSRRDYLRDTRKAFDDSSPEGRLQLERALYVMSASAHQFPDDSHANLVERSGTVVWLPSRIADYTEDRKHLKWVAVERAAELEYDQAASKTPYAAAASLLLYLLATCLIVWVVYSQSREILAVSGIL